MARWLAITAPLVTGCAVLLGLEEPSFEGAGPVTEAGTDGVTACPSDRTSDPNHCGRCGRSCLGATCRDAMCESQLLTQGHGAIVALAVDDEFVYFDSFTQWVLGRVPKAGGGVLYLLPEGGLKEPTGGLVTDGPFIYASAYTSGSGAGVRRLLTDGGSDAAVAIDDCNTAWSVVLDQGNVYWLTGRCGGAPRLRRRAKEELDASATISSLTDDRFAMKQYDFARLGYTALDGTDVFWVSKNHVLTLPKDGIDGTMPRTMFSLPLDMPERFRSIAVADRVYAMAGGRILAIPKGGGEAVVLASGYPVADGRAGLAVDGGDVYFTSPEAGVVARVRTTGGAVETLAKGQDKPAALTLDAKFVYWADTGDGSIHRVAR